MSDLRELVRDLGRLLDRATTKSGHLAQVVGQEHRGNCPVRAGCTPACQEAQALRLQVRLYLLETSAGRSPRPVGAARRRRFSPPSRRSRAVPGRGLLPGALGRRRVGGAVL